MAEKLPINYYLENLHDLAIALGGLAVLNGAEDQPLKHWKNVASYTLGRRQKFERTPAGKKSLKQQQKEVQKGLREFVYSSELMKKEGGAELFIKGYLEALNNGTEEFAPQKESFFTRFKNFLLGKKIQEKEIKKPSISSVEEEMGGAVVSNEVAGNFPKQPTPALVEQAEENNDNFKRPQISDEGLEE